MRFLARPAFFMALMLGAMLSATVAQTAQKQATGTITGRVTVGDKAAANVGVVLFPAERMMERSAVARASTDYEGRYRLTNVPAGRYSVLPVAPAMVGPNEGLYGEPGKIVTIAEAETVEKIDFSLSKGGVISGRVTDGDGAPVIAERVQLNRVDKPNQNRISGSFSNFNPFMYETDDRGIYRLYGIPPGRYTISIGEATEGASVRFGAGDRGYYTRTFHPDVTEEAKARTIEIEEGTEVLNVDINVGRKAKSFVASGRVVDENGKAVAGARVGNGALMADGKRMGGFGWGSVTDANGGFRLDGLMPGRYAAFVWNEGDSENYSDTVTFEITDGNVSGLEVKLHRGSSISGVAVIEGTTDRAALAKLSQMTLTAGVETTEGLGAPSFASVKIAPDGSFYIKGLRPGKARLHLSTYPPVPGFSLARVEREGARLREIEITSGEQVTGLRVVIEYGSGSVRGVVKVEGGELPEDVRMFVSARRRGEGAGAMPRGSQVDSRGRFIIEGMTTGEYELTLQTIITGSTTRRIAPIKQNVTITNGVEAEVTLTLNLGAQQPEDRNNE